MLPRSAAIIWIGGEPFLLIGTSSSLQEFAGVLALAVEVNHGRLGNVNPLIYTLSCTANACWRYQGTEGAAVLPSGHPGKQQCSLR